MQVGKGEGPGTQRGATHRGYARWGRWNDQARVELALVAGRGRGGLPGSQHGVV